MGVIIKQSIQNTIISYIGIVLGFVTTILLFPNILRQDQYGLTRLLISITMICAQFAHLGVKNTVIRYFPYFQDSKESRSKFLTLALVVPLAGFALFSVLLVLLGDDIAVFFEDRSALFSTYYLYLIPLVFGMLFFDVINNYIRALQDSVTGSFVNEILVRAFMILLLIIYYYQLISFGAFMAAFVATYCVQPFYLLIYLYRRGELSLTFAKLTKRPIFLKNMGIYGAYSLLGGLATLLVGNIDIIMLGAMTDLNSTAVYAIAFYVGSVIAVPQRSIIKIATPILAGLLKEKKYKQIDSLYKRTSLNQIIAGTLLYIGIWANIHNLFHLLPANYQGAKWIIIVVGAAKLFDMATGINGGIISNSKYFRFDLYTNLLLIGMTIVTNFFLIRLYGMLGAAIATAISIFIYNFIKFIFVWITFSMQPFRLNSLAVLIIAAGCLLLSFQIPYLGNFITDLLIRSAIITLIYTGVILLFNLSDDLKNLLLEGYSRIRAYL